MMMEEDIFVSCQLSPRPLRTVSLSAILLRWVCLLLMIILLLWIALPRIAVLLLWIALPRIAILLLWVAVLLLWVALPWIAVLLLWVALSWIAILLLWIALPLTAPLSRVLVRYKLGAKGWLPRRNWLSGFCVVRGHKLGRRSDSAHLPTERELFGGLRRNRRFSVRCKWVVAWLFAWLKCFYGSTQLFCQPCQFFYLLRCFACTDIALMGCSCNGLHQLHNGAGRLHLLVCHLVNGFNFSRLMLNNSEERLQGGTSFLGKLCADRSFLLGVLHGNGGSLNLLKNVTPDTGNHRRLFFCSFRQTADIRCDCAKAFAVFAGHRGLNSGVQSQTIGEVGNSGYHIYDAVDLS